ncbi:relaxase/mobilization nuclease domain-containing protein [Marinobacter nauticus]|uniref:relaxase/mobilization nuclease domain-containing protein n=1 Tax=Marinobacter nauticus TaxID=2743 RepID=UPI001D19588A|nr:relaxase/mobilization nuclease domain-containing protein [Marinobacter nauticus]MCC4272189.1 relaxase/mobilization nuclease domain-containing protein [Marinobacter nauticus]
MIHRKLTYRNSSGKTLRYIYRGDGHEHEVIDIYHVASQSFAKDPIVRGADGLPVEIDTDLLESELDSLADKNQRSDLRFAHYIISLPENEKLPTAQWEQVVRYYLAALGYDDQSKWTAVLHNDTDNQHVHILACRVVNNPEFGYRLISDSNDHDKGMAAMRDLERFFGLKVTPSPAETWGVDLGVAAYKGLQKRDASFVTDDSWINRIRPRLAYAVERSRGSSFSSFLQNCRRNGVDPIVKMNPDGYPVGISYGFEGRYLSGSKIKSTRLTLPALTGQKYCSQQKRMMPTGRSSEGIIYDHIRDYPAAKLCADRTPTNKDFAELGQAPAPVVVSRKAQSGGLETGNRSVVKAEGVASQNIAGAPLSASFAMLSGKSGIDELVNLGNFYVDLALNAAHAKAMRRLRDFGGVGNDHS